mgnify:CR=1 FL=1
MCKCSCFIKYNSPYSCKSFKIVSSFDEDTDDSGVQLKAELEEEDADDMTAEEGEPWNRK